MDNCTSPTQTDSESKRRENKHGHFYNGNMTVDAADEMKKEGAKGLAYDQGAVRCSYIPKMDSGGHMSHNTNERLEEEGSDAHLEY